MPHQMQFSMVLYMADVLSDGEHAGQDGMYRADLNERERKGLYQYVREMFDPWRYDKES